MVSNIDWWRTDPHGHRERVQGQGGAGCHPAWFGRWHYPSGKDAIRDGDRADSGNTLAPSRDRCTSRRTRTRLGLASADPEGPVSMPFTARTWARTWAVATGDDSPKTACSWMQRRRSPPNHRPRLVPKSSQNKARRKEQGQGVRGVTVHFKVARASRRRAEKAAVAYPHPCHGDKGSSGREAPKMVVATAEQGLEERLAANGRRSQTAYIDSVGAAPRHGDLSKVPGHGVSQASASARATQASKLLPSTTASCREQQESRCALAPSSACMHASTYTVLRNLDRARAVQSFERRAGADTTSRCVLTVHMRPTATH